MHRNGKLVSQALTGAHHCSGQTRSALIQEAEYGIGLSSKLQPQGNFHLNHTESNRCLSLRGSEGKCESMRKKKNGLLSCCKKLFQNITALYTKRGFPNKTHHLHANIFLMISLLRILLYCRIYLIKIPFSISVQFVPLAKDFMWQMIH